MTEQKEQGKFTRSAASADQRDPAGRMLIYVAIVMFLLVVLAADWFTPLGVAIWVFYLLPITLSLFLPNKAMPLIVAVVCTALMLVTLLTDSPGTNREIAQLNRGFGILMFWMVAAVGYFYIANNVILRRQAWIQSGKAGLAESMGGELKPEAFGESVLSFVVEFLGAKVGAFFVNQGDKFHRTATYGIPSDAVLVESADASEGLLGCVIRSGQRVSIADVPDGYLTMGSSLGQVKPTFLMIAPMKVDGEVNGLLEMGFTEPMTDDQIEFLDRISEPVGVAVASSRYRANLQRLLAETQHQARELQHQGEELRVTNEELEVQSRALQESQTQLEQQQIELEQTNVQLEEQTQLLVSQRDELAKATISTQAKAKELEVASGYKSDFLANMSHELRTPLNSSLILSKLLAENAQGNLTSDQVTSAETIHAAGNDLLNLINDILDLSKIEAGKMSLRTEEVSLPRLTSELIKVIRPIAVDKGLDLGCQIADDVPELIRTDKQRLEQILKNLLSNAIKFTDRGSVDLSLDRLPGDRIAISVRDTGIGIAKDKQAAVFEAFEQLDSAANRRFRGTGLGLTITTELTRILGGEIELTSELNQGSKFTIILPIRYEPAETTPSQTSGTTVPGVARDGRFDAASPRSRQPSGIGAKNVPEDVAADDAAAMVQSALATAHEVLSEPQNDPKPPAKDDREHLGTDQRVILIVEDDQFFASMLAKIAHDLDFRCLIAESASEALSLATRHRPQAILLDVGLPDETGLFVLDRLKQDARTRHIPVHMISGNDFSETALAMGAIGYVVKPATHEMLLETLQNLKLQINQRSRRVLIVEDDPRQLQSLQKLLESREVTTVGAASVQECLQQLSETTFDCMVLDLTLPDSSGYALLETLSGSDEHSFPPVIIYTGHELTTDQEQLLRRYSQSIIIKGAKSPERLLDEVALFLHQVVDELPEEQQQMIRKARSRETVLEDRRVLIVEDDVRNIFALTSILEPRGAVIDIARNGIEALAAVNASVGDPNRTIDLVLMDVMMPEMDGLTATREIRKRPELASLPIVMLTAKAMKDDQAECIDAGANDYMAKPLDVDKLLSLVRVWIRKR